MILTVPYFSQRNNLSGQGYRECFSSSCAMLAAYFGRVSTDDEYNDIRAHFGDTTLVEAQLKALRSLRLKPRFKSDGTLRDLIDKANHGCPVAVGWFHNGHVSRPTGSGHWSVVVAHTPSHTIHNDPYGEANLIDGGYINANGEGILYSNANWLRRWSPGGMGGWYLYCKV